MHECIYYYMQNKAWNKNVYTNNNGLQFKNDKINPF